MRINRWNDTEKYWGPFTWSWGKTNQYGTLLSSKDTEYTDKCSLRMHFMKLTVIVDLPNLISPYKEPFEYNGKQYYHTHRRVFGFTISDGNFLLVRYGAQTMDSSTEKSWGYFLPWASTRHVRHCLYDLNGELWADVTHVRKSWEVVESQPSRKFLFKDFDGEEIIATTTIEEREWQHGTGWFKWMSWFRKPIISRYLELKFSKEMGPKKGSWKGGTIGHSIEIDKNTLHETAFKIYCGKYNLTFVKEIS